MSHAQTPAAASQGEGQTAAGPHLAFIVYGYPAPQGSKRHVGHGIMVESSDRLKPWREAVKAEARSTLEWLGLLGLAYDKRVPVVLTLTFRFPRPASHYRTGASSHLLRPAAPWHMAQKPDLDKLCRSTMDALTDAGVLHDDAQVVKIMATKTYAGEALLMGCTIDIRQASEVVG